MVRVNDLFITIGYCLTLTQYCSCWHIVLTLGETYTGSGSQTTLSLVRKHFFKIF